MIDWIRSLGASATSSVEGLGQLTVFGGGITASLVRPPSRFGFFLRALSDAGVLARVPALARTPSRSSSPSQPRPKGSRAPLSWERWSRNVLCLQNVRWPSSQTRWAVRRPSLSNVNVSYRRSAFRDALDLFLGRLLGWARGLKCGIEHVLNTLECLIPILGSNINPLLVHFRNFPTCLSGY